MMANAACPRVNAPVGKSDTHRVLAGGGKVVANTCHEARKRTGWLA